MARITCPTCGQQFDSDRSRAMPFCSERCRTIDLGRWLAEEQGLPVEPEDREDMPPEDREDMPPPDLPWRNERDFRR